MHALTGQSWWIWIIRGLMAILFGVLAFAMPLVTFGSLIMFFSAFIFVDGVFTLASLFFKRQNERPWWSTFLEGILGISIGVLTFMLPAMSALVFLMYIAGWALFTGILEIVSAIRLRKLIRGEWALGLAGALSIALGLAFIARPDFGMLTVSWMLGAYALTFGVLMLVVGFQLRKLEHSDLGDTHFPMRHA